MTSTRKSIVVARETGRYGSGVVNNGKYFRFPSNTFVSHTLNRSGESLYESGNKMRRGATYGSVSGTWKIPFVADYAHLEPFAMIYDAVVTFGPSGVDESTISETIMGKTFTKSKTVYDDIGTEWGATQFRLLMTAETRSGSSVNVWYLYDVCMRVMYEVSLPPIETLEDNTTQNCYKHYFFKRNCNVVGHFTFRTKYLHRIASDDLNSDEQTQVLGAVPTSLTVSRSSAGSEMKCELNGIYNDQTTDPVNLDATDYFVEDGDEITQQSCMFVDHLDFKDSDYIWDIDSHSITIENSAALIKNTCTGVAKRYTEGQNKMSWSASTYHNDVVNKFLRRPFSGGVNGTQRRPKSKNLKPMAHCWFVTYNGEVDPEGGTTTDDVISTAYKESTRSLAFWSINSTIRNMTWPEGNNTLMKQVLNNVECDQTVLIAVNARKEIWHDDDSIVSVDATGRDETREFAVTTFNNAKSAWRMNYVNFKVYGTPVFNIIEYKRIAQSSIALTAPIEIEGYVVIPATVSSTSGTGQPTVKTLNNLSGKQLITSAVTYVASGTGAVTQLGNLGLTVGTNISGTSPVVQISGTPSYKGTDYYLIVKPHTQASTTTADASTEVDAIGYLRVDVV